MPTNSKDYVHRVGRTARAGRSGKSITLVTQYDVEILQRIEAAIGKKMVSFDVDKEAVAVLFDTVAKANREAALEMREQGTGGGGGKRGRDKGKKRGWEGDDQDRDDDVVEAGVPRKKNKFKQGGKGKARLILSTHRNYATSFPRITLSTVCDRSHAEICFASSKYT